MTTDSVNQSEKTCYRCGKKKPLDDFYRRRKSRDGRAEQCKKCARAAVDAWQKANPEQMKVTKRRYRKENREKITEAERRRRQENPILQREGQRRYRKAHPGKVKARNALRTAIKGGFIARPERCKDCRCRVEVQAHHRDYDKPLDVEWLCRDCHWQRHVSAV